MSESQSLTNAAGKVLKRPAMPGAGRPKGSMSKIAEASREAAKQSGKLPHEILLDMARGHPVRTFVDSGQVDEDGKPIFKEKFVALDPEGVRDAAKAAAPYFAPKISTVEVITGVSDDELDAIIAGAAAAAGISLGADGEGETDEVEEGPPVRNRVRVRVE